MALTKIQNTGIADDAVTTDKIENSTVLAADIAPGTLTNAKLSNSAVTINGTSVTLGGSTSIKHIDWQALTVADGSTTLTAEAGKGYFLDTNVGVIEVFLPTSPSRGDTIILVDYSGTFGTNQIIINTGGNLIDSTTGPDFKVTANNSIVELVYVDSNKGWLVKLNQAAGTTPSSALSGFQSSYDTPEPLINATGGTITTSGDFKIHHFTGDGCFVVSGGGGDLGVVGYVIVAGGGGGGRDDGGGGGGGGFRCGPGAVCARHIPMQTGTYPVTVGAGGAGGSSPSPRGAQGSNSVVSTITSAGGGGAGGGNCDHDPTMNGGSGAGAGFTAEPSSGNTLGQGNTPPVSPPQGNNGGGGFGHHNTGAGGGGANAAATNSSSQYAASSGGNGTPAEPIFGPNPKPYYAAAANGPNATFGGGGGGGALQSAGTGGNGGGGDGRAHGSPTGVGVAGDANHGGGGGGGANHPGPRCGGAGGKGIVLLKYRFQA